MNIVKRAASVVGYVVKSIADAPKIAVDYVVSTISPTTGIKRRAARVQEQLISRSFQGAEASRLTANKHPKNLAADQELLGPFGADAARAWGREFRRNNAYAWGVVDTIVSNVVGNGITAQSVIETPDGEDVENINETRDSLFEAWAEVCEINGQYTLYELQAMAQSEMVEAGEVLVRIVRTPGATYKGISRPVPLALELIEADRLAGDRDTYAARLVGQNGNRIVRGVEVDEQGKPVAYWIYPDHPNAPYALTKRVPDRVPADQILHLFRRDRIGQTRGVTWFAPVMQWIRDLQNYVDNEIQASAVAACFSVMIKTNSPAGGLYAPEGEDVSDRNGNTQDYLEPGVIARLGVDESVEVVNPLRPNASADTFVKLILRGISVGTGLSYEVVARDYSQTSYSSSRTSQLEDRRRYRRWQRYLVDNLCMPVWDEFCNAAARQGLDAFPTSTELLEDRRKIAAVEWQTQTWEWVDPQSEIAAAVASIKANLSDNSFEAGQRGGHWRTIMNNRAKEERYRKECGLWTDEELKAMAAGVDLGQKTTGAVDPSQTQSQPAPTGEYSQMNRLQQIRNNNGIDAAIKNLESGTWDAARTEVALSMLGVSEDKIAKLLADYQDDGIVQSPEVVNG